MIVGAKSNPPDSEHRWRRDRETELTYHTLLLEELFNSAHERLGDAVLEVQGRYVETGAMPELLSIYHLLGDPALRIR